MPTKRSKKKLRHQPKHVTFAVNANGYQFAVYQPPVTINGQPTRLKKRRRIPEGCTESDKWKIVEDLIADTNTTLEAIAAADTAPAVPAIDTRKITGHTLTWATLAAWYTEHYLGEPEFNADRKLIAGCLSWKPSRRQLRFLVGRLGPNKLVRDLTTEDLRKFKSARLAEPVVVWKYDRDPVSNRIRVDGHGAPLKIVMTHDREFGSVHRELAMIRHMLNLAAHPKKRWVILNPWDKDLIDPDDERGRDTIATTTEETALIDSCDHTKRRHLFLYLTVMFDSGCRSAELRRLLVKDCNFETSEFVVYSFKGSKRRERVIGMTPRARVALLEGCAAAGKTPEDFVFTYNVNNHVKGSSTTPDSVPCKRHRNCHITTTHRPLKAAPKRAFNTAKRLAKWWSDDQVNLSNFRGHDIRHTHLTRLANSNQHSTVNMMKHSGHTQLKTFMRYTNPDHAERAKIADTTATYTATPARKPEVTAARAPTRKRRAA